MTEPMPSPTASSLAPSASPDPPAIRCLRCKHDVRGISVSLQCPECGTPLAPRVQARVQRRRRRRVVLALGVAAAVAGAVVFFVFPAAVRVDTPLRPQITFADLAARLGYTQPAERIMGIVAKTGIPRESGAAYIDMLVSVIAAAPTAELRRRAVVELTTDPNSTVFGSPFPTLAPFRPPLLATPVRPGQVQRLLDSGAAPLDAELRIASACAAPSEPLLDWYAERLTADELSPGPNSDHAAALQFLNHMPAAWAPAVGRVVENPLTTDVVRREILYHLPYAMLRDDELVEAFRASTTNPAVRHRLEQMVEYVRHPTTAPPLPLPAADAEEPAF